VRPKYIYAVVIVKHQIVQYIAVLYETGDVHHMCDSPSSANLIKGGQHVCLNDSRNSGLDNIRIDVVNVAAEEEVERGGANLNLQLDLDVRERVVILQFWRITM
jgi:hypothetical protein